MSVLGNRRGGNPVTFNLDKSCTRLNRVAFTEKKFQEGWLQDLIETNPEILPIDDIEPAFASPVPVGREVPTKAGAIDNLLLSPRGYLTIVETKLWRNPEARRLVVAQLIDYAKDISRWTFQELEKVVLSYNMQYHHNNLGILDTLRTKTSIDENEEPLIVDTISRNLRAGRFLLLVVGDGIRESVEEMAEFLQKTPQLHFTLALVELQLYEFGAQGTKPYLVLPQIVARTAEVTRAVVRVEGKDIDSVKVQVDTEITTPPEPPKKFTITEEAFFNTLSQNVDPKDLVDFTRQFIKDMQGFGCVIQWRQASFIVTLPDPGGSGQRLSLLIVSKTGNVQLSELSNQLRSVGLPDEIAFDYARESAKLFRREVNQKYPGVWSNNVALGEIHQQYQEFVAIVQKTIDRIKQVAKKQSSN